MRYAPAFNPTDTPVVVDDDGRTLAGLAWGPIDRDAPEVLQAVNAGRLVIPDEADVAVDDLADDAAGEVRQAVVEAAELDRRLEAWQQAPDDVVEQVAEAHGLAGDDRTPGELAARLARAAVMVPDGDVDVLLTLPPARVTDAMLADAKIDVVQAYLEAHPDQGERVRSVEAQRQELVGKAPRKSILEA